MEAVLFIGIPGSGKSTFYREKFFDSHVRINLDMLKTRHREMVLFEACINARQSFVVDNTNITLTERARYIPLARQAGFRVVGYYFRANLKAALQRNQLRSGKALIPSKAVAARFHQLELPDYSEGFDELFYVRIDPVTNKFMVEEWKDEV
jgi:predicted kinase